MQNERQNLKKSTQLMRRTVQCTVYTAILQVLYIYILESLSCYDALDWDINQNSESSIGNIFISYLFQDVLKSILYFVNKIFFFTLSKIDFCVI